MARDLQLKTMVFSFSIDCEIFFKGIKVYDNIAGSTAEILKSDRKHA